MSKLFAHTKEKMDQIVRIDIAEEIIEKLIAQECKNGVDENNKILRELLKMKEEVYKNNTEVIDYVINQYRNAIKAGENNE